ncbi:hypothetical protein BCR41DRAFT_411420 [Lobosporangium transversale]|uniref:Uncharacterized protein n=1 Tax=Lobosporangium transversale TaxID=64571 RepID=A0A1Y2GE55_9FUNG|nr:hypothetical protein BCR41DRAFT_411420 [Lobosporangium transversale]ORZ08293.1 hypothetical protein BCR41DRAFT_411420 [Lobosporangium transversale]|eukprot:XP_021878376.1 hypothetical protein BCR41DRAFT_411420 [Lobosporangium transversale]
MPMPCSIKLVSSPSTFMALNNVYMSCTISSCQDVIMYTIVIVAIIDAVIFIDHSLWLEESLEKHFRCEFQLMSHVRNGDCTFCICHLEFFFFFFCSHSASSCLVECAAIEDCAFKAFKTTSCKMNISILTIPLQHCSLIPHSLSILELAIAKHTRRKKSSIEPTVSKCSLGVYLKGLRSN